MNQHDLALELLTVAARDERAADVLLRAEGIDDTIIGFHLQQAAEKLLMALLAERSVDYPRTHNLAQPVSLVRQHGYEYPDAILGITALTPFAATLRYAREVPLDRLDREHARALVTQLRQWVERQIGEITT